jgi:hypothetical protein
MFKFAIFTLLSISSTLVSAQVGTPADWLNSQAYDVASCSNKKISFKIVRVTTLNDTKEHRQRPVGPQMGLITIVSPTNIGPGITAQVEYIRDSLNQSVVDVVVSTNTEVVHLGTTSTAQKVTFLGSEVTCTKL